MTATFITDPSDFCRNRCVKGRVHIDLGDGKYMTEPCHWCGGSGLRSVRLEQVTHVEGMGA